MTFDLIDLELPGQIDRRHVSKLITGSNCREKTERLGSFQEINTDQEAVALWLHNQYRDKKKTKQIYEKELTRFMMWAHLEAQTPLSGLNEQHIERYFEFILDPQPRTKWCLDNPKARPKRQSEKWRPFAGPIQSIASYNQVMSALSQCFAYLFKARYLRMNPFLIIQLPAFKISQEQRRLDVHQRLLNPQEWNALVDTLVELPEETYDGRYFKQRLRFIVSSLFFLGLRVEELVNLRWSDFVQLESHWLVCVAGKARQHASEADTILCPDAYWREVRSYRRALKLPQLPQEAETEHAICNHAHGGAITTSTVRKMIKSLARSAAERFEKGSLSYRKLCAVSPHWLRHLCASRLSQNEVNITHIKQHMRHRSSHTTQLYIHSDMTERQTQIDSLQLKQKEHK